MKHIQWIAVLAIFALGCSQVSNEPQMQAETMQDMHEAMVAQEGTPCQQMPNGESMGDCGDNVKEDLSSLSTAKSSSILTVNDGDHITITADIVKKRINGKEVKMYAYNGMIPGVALRTRQGSTIEIDFINNLDQETTIHWHGLRHDINNDGVPDISQETVKPGEKYQYTVTFPDAGIYWYHPHVREDLQQDLGLAGNMLVDSPESDYYNPINKEELLVLDDILMNDHGVVPFGKEHANFALMGRFGNVMLLNGETDYRLSVNKGDIVRFFVTNVANVRPFNLDFDGARIKLVASDLSRYEEEEFIDSVLITPAERYVIEVYFDESRKYNIRHITPDKEYVLGSVIAASTAGRADHSADFLKPRKNEEESKEMFRFKKLMEKDPDYEIDLTVEVNMMMGSMEDMPCHVMGGVQMGDCDGEEHEEEIEWEDTMGMMNAMSTSETVDWILKDRKTGRTNMEIGMEAKVGDIIKIRLFNDPESDHPMQHPIHLHGQRFLVTSIDGEQQDNLAWKDTVLVPAGKTIDILVDVTNPGEWMMHCHIAEHLEAGMMTSFNVET
ncbi:multicopper oxidase family protein [Candidatus Woesearchaeota archaeon]|nr:multicopper oxidase family protein [Candidatus Woesearchaeota archaeon]